MLAEETVASIVRRTSCSIQHPAAAPAAAAFACPQVSLHVDGQSVGYTKIFNAPIAQTFEGFLKAGGAQGRRCWHTASSAAGEAEGCTDPAAHALQLDGRAGAIAYVHLGGQPASLREPQPLKVRLLPVCADVQGCAFQTFVFSKPQVGGWPVHVQQWRTLRSLLRLGVPSSRDVQHGAAGAGASC